MIPDITFQNPSVVFLFRTLRNRETSEPVFLTNFAVKYEGLERSNEGLGVTFTTLKVVVVVVGLVAAHRGEAGGAGGGGCPHLGAGIGR